MELRSQTKPGGPQIRPRATSEGRTQLGSDNPPTTVTLVNPSSSATGSTRGGKSSFRTLPRRDQRHFKQRPVTPPGPVRRGCYVCGALGCHTVIHERNGTLPSNFRRAPPTGNNDRNRGNNNNNSRLNANARVFTPSSNGRHQPPSGNSGGNPASGNRVPPLQRPSSA